MSTYRKAMKKCPGSTWAYDGMGSLDEEAGRNLFGKIVSENFVRDHGNMMLHYTTR